MTESVINFPSQAVSDLEKLTLEYGEEVAKAIRQEWFSGTTNKFNSQVNNFHKLRLYARGEQSIQKYKNELSINGDLSYLNLDWKPVPIIPKFVDIVVNGMAQRTFEINAYSQDQSGVNKRTEYMESILRDIRSREFNDAAKENFGVDLYENKQEELPGTEEELALHMQLGYKQSVELAKDWRTDKYLRRLEALMAIGDKENSYIISGTGDVLEPEGDVIGIGSGGNYALAAGKVLMEGNMSAEEVAKKAIKVAAEICVFTNENVKIEKI